MAEGKNVDAAVQCCVYQCCAE